MSMRSIAGGRGEAVVSATGLGGYGVSPTECGLSPHFAIRYVSLVDQMQDRREPTTSTDHLEL
jgi:hypothetical protein